MSKAVIYGHLPLLLTLSPKEITQYNALCLHQLQQQLQKGGFKNLISFPSIWVTRGIVRRDLLFSAIRVLRGLFVWIFFSQGDVEHLLLSQDSVQSFSVCGPLQSLRPDPDSRSPGRNRSPPALDCSLIGSARVMPDR